jgi:hypothetical protein
VAAIVPDTGQSLDNASRVAVRLFGGDIMRLDRRDGHDRGQWAGRLARAQAVLERTAADRFILSLVLFVTLISAIKSRKFLVNGRFWAEEGRDFYARICERDLAQGLSFTYNNHLELFTNIGVLIATRLPPAHAPLFTTIYSAAFVWALIALVAWRRKDLRIGKAGVFVFALCALGMPQAAEVWANTINLHFVLLAIGAIILLLPTDGRGWMPFSVIVLALCGLGGIPPAFLIPIFVLSAVVERDPLRILQGLALGGGAAVQIMILIQTGYSGERELSASPDIMLFAILTQNFWGLFGGYAGGAAAGAVFGLFETGGLAGRLAALTLAAGSLLLGAKLLRVGMVTDSAGSSGWLQLKGLLAAVWIGGVCVALALGDRSGLISAVAGGRYFWASSLVLVILFMMEGPWGPLHRRAMTVLVVTASLGLLKNFNGPDWHVALADRVQIPAPSGQGEYYGLGIWPHGWTMSIPATCL